MLIFSGLFKNVSNYSTLNMSNLVDIRGKRIT